MWTKKEGRGAAMISRASIALLVLLVGSVSLPAGFASAADSSAASKAQLQKAQQAKALRAKKAKQQEEQKKKEWYENDRDRGLDIASEYAPKEIAKVRKNNYIAKGDAVSTGNGKKGWQQYMNKYYSR